MRSRRPVAGLTLLAVAVATSAAVVYAVLRDRAAQGDDRATAPSGAADAQPAGLLDDPVVLLDTRTGFPTVDGQFAGAGPIEPGAPVELSVRDRHELAGDSGLIALTVTPFAVGDGDVAAATVATCDVAEAPPASTIARHVVLALGGADTVCVTTAGTADVRVELAGFLDPAEVRPVAGTVRLVDSRADGETSDDRFAAIGVRPERSTLRVPVTDRFDGFDGFGAVVVGLSVDGALEDGAARVFAAESSPPASSQLEYVAEESSGTTALVPLGSSGDVCVSTTGRTDVVIDLLAVVPDSAVAPVSGEGECPGQTVFPSRRLVAMYGTQRSGKLGVLGEQAPEAAADRMEEIAAPWRAGDRPVQPAFELIATLATATPEDGGVYNIRSEPEFVQEYLDVARRHGYYLILDLQPGQSDFLTEAKVYEEFLRQPDVGLALDPEWRTQAPARPRGGSIGTVDAVEVNAVIDYLADLVAEEGLPEKLLVVHQFTDRMITNRDRLVEQPGVALTIHMDGFGDRPNKQSTWELVRADPPWNMALKLFFDEDIDIYTAEEVLGGAFDPVPDLVTYQ